MAALDRKVAVIGLERFHLSHSKVLRPGDKKWYLKSLLNLVGVFLVFFDILLILVCCIFP